MSVNVPSTYGSTAPQSDDTAAQAVAADLQSSLLKAQFGLDVALCIGSLGCLVGLYFLRRNVGYDLRTLPMWTVAGSLVAVFLFEIFNLPIVSQNWSKATDHSVSYIEFYYPGLILAEFFRHVAICALFYLFYRMTHLCIYHSSDGKKPSSNIKILHWSILGIITGTAVIDWVFYTHKTVILKDIAGMRGVSSNYGELLYRQQRMNSAAQIIRWVASAEILAWNIAVVTKSMRFYPNLRVSTVFLLFGSVFFFALNMAWAVFDINYFLTRENVLPTALAGVYVTQAVFFMLVYVGMLPFCMRWGLLQRKEPQKDVETKGPRNRGPVEVEENPVSLNTAVEAQSRNILEANSRDILEAGEPKQIFEADSGPVVFEADSKPLNEHSPVYDVYKDSK